MRTQCKDPPIGSLPFLHVPAAKVMSPRPPCVMHPAHTMCSLQGYAAVRLMVEGVPTEVVVDTLFPVWSVTGGPCFARAKGEELWVMILEKAYAKACGRYSDLNGGDPGDALTDLTGFPYYTLRAKGTPNPAGLWVELLRRHSEGFLFCATVPEVRGTDYEHTVGIVEGHAYAVLDVREVGGHQLLHVRNPWGSVAWTGAWSDAWPGWTPELRQAVSGSDAGGGMFWMALPDFTTYFGNVQFLALRRGWVQTHCCGVAQLDSPALFGFTLPEATAATVTLHQPRLRAIAMRFCVLKKGNGEPVGGSSAVFDLGPAMSCEKLKLEPGAYVVLVQVWPSTAADLLPAPFVLEVCAPAEVPVGPSAPAQGVAYRFLLPQFAQEYGVCGKCGIALGQACVTALGKKWHQRCWVCCVCAAPIKGKFAVRKGLPLCLACAAKEEPDCMKCKQHISGAYLAALGGKWHPQCFTCCICQQQISGSFVVHQGQPAHAKCVQSTAS